MFKSKKFAVKNGVIGSEGGKQDGVVGAFNPLPWEKQDETARQARVQSAGTGGGGGEPSFTISGIFSLFRSADKVDIALMSIGFLVAVANGLIMPAMSMVFGEMTDVFLSVEKHLRDPQFKDNSTTPIFKGEIKFGRNSTNSSSSNENFFNEAYFFSKVNIFTYYYLGLAVTSFVASFIQIYCWETASERQIYRLRKVYFSQILRQDVGWFDQNEDGDLASKLTDDFERMRNGLGSKVPLVTQYVSQFVGGLVVGFCTSWKLSLVLCFAAPLLVTTSAVAAAAMSGAAMREQLRYGVASGIATEVLTCIKTVVAFGGELNEVNRYNTAMEEGRLQTMLKYYSLSAAMAISSGLIYSVYALGFWYGSNMFALGKIEPGQIFTVFFSVLVAAFAIGNSLPVIAEITNAIGASSVVFSIIDQIPKIDVYSKEGTIPDKLQGQIVFKDVKFSYPARRDVQVLNGLNLTIESGNVVAVVGSSGAGKSTLVGLLMRFYDPTGGEILIDGKNIKDVNLNWLRSQIGVVSQEPVLFGVSIAENIRYGNRDATQEDIIKAAKLANAHRFITGFPDGYDTLVGDLGAMMSGGQKQRIAIARALLRDPKILLLDEATSALDAESEAAVQSALNNAMSGRTTIIIAHRLSTVRDVDTIYAMQDGLVYEQGSHDELMEKEGLYHNLVIMQKKKARDQEENVPDSTFSEVNLQASKRPASIRRRDSTKSLKNLNEKEDSARQEVPDVSYFDLFKLSTAQWPLLCVSVICCIFLGLHLPVFALIYSQVLEVFFLTGNAFYRAVGFWSIMFVLLAILTSIAYFTAVLCSSIATEKLIQLLRTETFRNILSQQVSWFDEEEYTPLRLTNTLAKDPPLIKATAGMRAGIILQNAVTILAAIGITFYSSWKLALIVCAFLPILIIISWKQCELKTKQYERELACMEDASKMASECIQNVRTVHLLGLQAYMSQKYSDDLLDSHVEAKRQGLYFSIAFALTQSSLFLVYAIAYKFGSYMLDNGEMGMIDIYRVVFCMGFSFPTLGYGCIFFQDFVKSKTSVSYVFKLLKLKSSLNTYSEEGLKPEIKGKVTFKNVGFGYPNRKDTPVLTGLDLNIEVGQTVALVGGSGCGKSTTVALLERFYSPERGQIFVDDLDVTTLNVSHLRKSMGIVTQEPVLFDCSIRDNIAYGLISQGKKVTDQQIIEAAKRANIHNFITNLPQGYDTPAGDRGTQLSGGQKQRVAIARALIREPKILLLDEATSALDNESEQIVQEALDKASQGRTSIIIAHRLSTIRGADLIVVIDKGKVVEKGTHEQLKNLQGHYYNLIKKQEENES